MHVIGAAVIAMFVGMILNGVLKKTKLFASGLKFTSKKLLKFAIILLGLSLNIRTILNVGKMSLAVMVFTLLTCFGGGYFIDRALGLNWKLSNLISAGTGICGGVMPWVFKRPWTTTAIQTVDGNDLPTYAYYAVQNSYRPINICWCQEWSLLAPNEELSLCVKVFNQNEENLSDAEIRLTVYRPDLTVFAEYTSKYAKKVDLGRLVLDGGPWLKPSVASAKKAELAAVRVASGSDGRYEFADACIKNLSNVPAYPVTVDLVDEEKRFFLDDNFFMLKAGEEKTVRVTCDKGRVGDIRVSCWNGDSAVI